MAKLDPHLFTDPLAQANFHRAVLVGYEWAEGQAAGIGVGVVFHQSTLKRAAISADNCRAKVNEYLRFAALCVLHGILPAHWLIVSPDAAQ